MRISWRITLILLLAVIILIVVVIFWPFILNSILRPIAMVAWLFLRMFVLSIGQSTYWIAIILAAFYFLLRLLSQSPRPQPQEQSVGTNEMTNTMLYWRILFSLNETNSQDEISLKRELTGLMVSMYASKQRGARNFEIYESLKSRQIPLPDNIHSFLFPKEEEESKPITARKLLRSMREAPHKWLWRWSGQEKAEKYRMIEEILAFMETSLEIKNDERKSIPNEH